MSNDHQTSDMRLCDMAGWLHPTHCRHVPLKGHSLPDCPYARIESLQSQLTAAHAAQRTAEAETAKALAAHAIDIRDRSLPVETAREQPDDLQPREPFDDGNPYFPGELQRRQARVALDRLRTAGSPVEPSPERRCVCGLAAIPEGELRVEVGPTTHRLAGPCFQTSSVKAPCERCEDSGRLTIYDTAMYPGQACSPIGDEPCPACQPENGTRDV